MSDEFKREDRYIVIKRSDLSATPVYRQVELLLALEKLSDDLPSRECVVIESDWPEYEPVWQMIEDRMTGKTAELDRATAERNGLRLSLSTADQTIDDLNAAISRRTHRVRELEAKLAYAVDAINEVIKVSAMYEKPFEIATLAIGELSASAKPA